MRSAFLLLLAIPALAGPRLLHRSAGFGRIRKVASARHGREFGKEARCVALYRPYGDALPGASVVESQPGAFTVTRGEACGGITLAPEYSFARKGGRQ